ncbi:MAG: helix-turn-helix domain-containing protein [Solirubrobacterales bacterium]|nr:helix-turn-helix domain-containing protein [Solirubrobacterales bacterium]
MPRPRGYDKQFGHHALRNLREWQGITPSEVADRVVAAGGRLSAQTVRNIESGTTRPSLALLGQLLAALHSDPERLEQVRVELIEANEKPALQAAPYSAPPGSVEAGAPMAMRRAPARPASIPDGPGGAHTPAVSSAAPPPPRRGGRSDRPSLPAPQAPEPWEALRELGDIYSQLDASGRHALIGRARQLLATQQASNR